MPNVKTNEMHALMVNNLKKAEDYLAQLQAQQRDIDEKIEDVTRVILGAKRLIGTLSPAIGVKVVDFKEDELTQKIADNLTDFEKELAIRSAT